MLGCVAAQLYLPNRRPVSGRRPVWFDIGGGTGYNIEVMHRLIDIGESFDHVYLIDLSPSLCEIARERVSKFGWTNVTVLCQDARAMHSSGQTADLITMSYSLSMIPDFYSVVDQVTTFWLLEELLESVTFMFNQSSMCHPGIGQEAQSTVM